MPPAATTGVGCTASTTAGTTAASPTRPVCPPASPPSAHAQPARVRHRRCQLGAGDEPHAGRQHRDLDPEELADPGAQNVVTAHGPLLPPGHVYARRCERRKASEPMITTGSTGRPGR